LLFLDGEIFSVKGANHYLDGVIHALQVRFKPCRCDFHASEGVLPPENFEGEGVLPPEDFEGEGVLPK
jgi:hypothetical protein